LWLAESVTEAAATRWINRKTLSSVKRATARMLIDPENADNRPIFLWAMDDKEWGMRGGVSGRERLVSRTLSPQADIWSLDHDVTSFGETLVQLMQRNISRQRINGKSGQWR